MTNVVVGIKQRTLEHCAKTMQAIFLFKFKMTTIPTIVPKGLLDH